MRLAVAENQWITSHLIERLVENDFIPELIINVGEQWTDRISGYSDQADIAKQINARLYRPKKYSLRSKRNFQEMISTVSLIKSKCSIVRETCDGCFGASSKSRS